MKIRKINKTAVPNKCAPKTAPGPVTLAIRALSPRSAYRFTCTSKTELARARVTAFNTASRDKLKIGTRQRGNDLYVFLKS